MLEAIIKELNKIEEKKLASDVIIAYAKKTSDVERLNLIAEIAFKNKLQYAARFVIEKALGLAIDNTMHNEIIENIKHNLTNVLIACNEPELVLGILKNTPENQAKIAHCHYLMGRLDLAEDILVKQLDTELTDEERNDIIFNLGTYNLWKGNFQLGLEQFLKHNKSTWNTSPLPFTKWEGEDISGKILLIKAEAGLGDEIINLRFVKHLKERGVKPIWFTDRKDVRDVLSAHGIDTTFQCARNDSRVVWCTSMMLPVLLKVEYSDLWSGPYLFASKKILRSDNTKIGLRWQGNSYFDNDLHRSLSLKDLLECIPSGAEIVSLQRDSGVEELDEHPGVVALHKTSLNTLAETMSEIDALDIVITSCTSIAHISAAMGKRTIVFVPLSTYYVWCNPNNTQPWYGDNLTVIRQEIPRDWSRPLLKLKEILKNEIM